MNIHTFIKQYGTDSASLMLEKVASYIDGEEKQIVTELAQNLREALRNYAEDDFEPSTINNEVI